MDWVPVAAPEPARTGTWAVIGADLGLDGPVHPDLDALGAEVPDTVVVACLPGGDGNMAEAARHAAHRALGLVQRWLDDDRYASPGWSSSVPRRGR